MLLKLCKHRDGYATRQRVAIFERLVQQCSNHTDRSFACDKNCDFVLIYLTDLLSSR